MPITTDGRRCALARLDARPSISRRRSGSSRIAGRGATVAMIPPSARPPGTCRGSATPGWSPPLPSPTLPGPGAKVLGFQDSDSADGAYALRLAAGFGPLVAASFAPNVLVALVRANEAGLACPDWPLCFGQALPEMDRKIGFEWTHRFVAGSVGLAFVALSALALRRPRTRGAAPLLAVGAALLALQVLLGALTVWKLLAPWTVTAHLVTGNAFAATLLLAALALREGASPRARPAVAAPARRWTRLAALLLALQIALGGLVASRYAGLACPEWPTCREGVWFPELEGPVALQLLHRTNAYALVTCLALAALAARGSPPLRRALLLALALGALQVAVGAANVLLRLPVGVTGLHSALATGLVLSLTWAVRTAWQGREAAAQLAVGERSAGPRTNGRGRQA